jgi:hypothetical protein
MPSIYVDPGTVSTLIDPDRRWCVRWAGTTDVRPNPLRALLDPVSTGTAATM